MCVDDTHPSDAPFAHLKYTTPAKIKNSSHRHELHVAQADPTTPQHLLVGEIYLTDQQVPRVIRHSAVPTKPLFLG